MPEYGRGVLWDMDGVLVDSADYHYIAWREALLAEGLAEYTPERFRKTFGQRNDTILRDIFGADYSDADIERVGGAKELRYRDLVRERGIQPLPGVRAWIERLHREGWHQAIASAAPRANVEAIVEILGIGPYIDTFTSAEDVTRGKPDPQVYLLAAERLKLPPSRCIVVEDAPAGIEGARRAGMRCIGVLSGHGYLDADLVVRSLTDLPPDAFERLLGELAD